MCPPGIGKPERLALRPPYGGALHAKNPQSPAGFPVRMTGIFKTRGFDTAFLIRLHYIKIQKMVY
jgi:hypothetical protein